MEDAIIIIISRRRPPASAKKTTKRQTETDIVVSDSFFNVARCSAKGWLRRLPRVLLIKKPGFSLAQSRVSNILPLKQPTDSCLSFSFFFWAEEEVQGCHIECQAEVYVALHAPYPYTS